MRILAIRGANIASLADPFEIDFTSDPLRSAGLFAITGETGAGKSSILDAMCLALYGNCPRLSAAGSNEKLPEGALATDPRSCLRRGAASGFAEVDFVGADAVSYRAKWEARRARNRADGTLQSVARSLKRLDDGTIIASQIKEVEKAVERTTALAYDEFRRSVLLAQGDFDAFLRADTNDRAALLEKITGTQIYRTISKRVFERSAEAGAALKALQTRRAEHRTKSDEERDTLDGEQKSLEEAGKADDLSRLHFETLIKRHERHESAIYNLGEAQKNLATIRNAFDEMAPDRARLAAHEKAAPLQPHFTRLSESQSTLQQVASAQATAVTRLQASQIESDAITQTISDVGAKLQHIETSIESFKADWDRAASLDTGIASAAGEARDARHAFEKAQTLRLDAMRLVGELADAMARLTTRREVAKKRADELAPLRPLAERWDEISGKIDKRLEFQVEARDAQKIGEQSAQDIQRVEAEIVAVATALEQARDKRTALDDQIARQTSALEAIGEDGMNARAVDFTLLAAQIEKLAVCARDCASADRESRDAQTLLAAARANLEQVEADINSARHATTIAETKLEALNGPLARAELAVSENASELRRRLTPGEPCPVCFATDHPVHADARIASLASQLRADVATARLTLATANRDSVDAKGRAAAASAQIAQASGIIERMTKRSADAHSSFLEHLNAAAPIAGKLAFALDIPAEPERASAQIEACASSVASQQESIASALLSAGALRRDIAIRVKERDKLSNVIETSVTAQSASQTERASASLMLSQASQSLSNARERLDSSAREIGAWIEAAGVDIGGLDREPVSARAILQKRAEEYRASVMDLADLEENLRQLTPKIAVAEAAVTSANVSCGEAEARLAQRQRHIDDLNAQRVMLLDGESTLVHRKRWDTARASIVETRDRIQLQHVNASSALSAAVEALEGAEKNHRSAHRDASNAQTSFTDALAQTGLDPDEVARLLSAPPADVFNLRDRLATFDKRLLIAEAAHAQRQKDLIEAQDGGIPDQTKSELVEARGELDQRREARHGRIGAIQSELSADDALRFTLTKLDREIADADAVLGVWTAVNEAVGSGTGDKFARFAQGMTLNILVELANVRLADIKPRYRLVRAKDELGLHIIDLDMGDEVRSTRSLSGGERFLVSLALALALSGIGGRQSFSDILFIDEGFGSLDAESLEVAIDALEMLQSQGRTVGVISHVDAMKDRIPVQIRVQKQGAGKSKVSITAPTGW